VIVGKAVASASPRLLHAVHESHIDIHEQDVASVFDDLVYAPLISALGGASQPKEVRRAIVFLQHTPKRARDGRLRLFDPIDLSDELGDFGAQRLRVVGAVQRSPKIAALEVELDTLRRRHPLHKGNGG
jgi:hypothetical protein